MKNGYLIFMKFAIFASWKNRNFEDSLNFLDYLQMEEKSWKNTKPEEQPKSTPHRRHEISTPGP